MLQSLDDQVALAPRWPASPFPGLRPFRVTAKLRNAWPQLPQKWEKMAKLNRRRRWRRPALGGRLQRAVRFCFAAHDGEATTPTLTEWCRPEVVHAGRRPSTAQMVNQARALRSIGAKRVRRAGRGWVWRLGNGEWLT